MPDRQSSPSESPSGEKYPGPGHWSSPWSFDHEWQDAPVPRRPPAAPPAEIRPAPQSRASEPIPAPAMPRQTPPEPKARVQATPVAKAKSPDADADDADLNLPMPPRDAVTTHTSTGDKKSSFLSAIIVSLAMFGLALIAWFYWQDPAARSDEDLRNALPVDQTPTVAAPQRLRSFLDSVSQVEEPLLAQRPPSLWDTPSLSKLISANGPALDNLRDLLEDFDWHPRHSAWHASDLGIHEKWPSVRVLLQAHAAYVARRGDQEAAFTTAIDLAELSRRLQDLWTWPSFMFRHQEMHTACVQTLAELLKQSTLSSDRLARFQQEFADCEPSDEVLRSALNALYIHEKKLLLGALSGEPLDTMPNGLLQHRPGRLFFKTNQTLELFADAFRGLKNEASTPPYAALNITGETLRRIRQNSPHFYQPNAAGERYFSERIDQFLRLPKAHSLAKAHHGLILTLFAVRRSLAYHGRLPSSVEELRPDFLVEVPADPFAGDPFRYDPGKGVLYSVGTDFINGGGRVSQPPLAEPLEPTVEIRAPAN